MWIFSLFFGGNRVQTFIFALSTTMFVVDRHSVKYAIHMKDHTQSMYDVSLGTNYHHQEKFCSLALPPGAFSHNTTSQGSSTAFLAGEKKSQNKNFDDHTEPFN